MKKVLYKLFRRLLCAGIVLAMTLSFPDTISIAAEVRQGPQSVLNDAVKDSENSSSGMITIGDTTFSSEEDNTFHWDGQAGWKNLAGQYVVLVDYDGTGEEISMDSGVLTLGVAGVNRIGTLKGNCSVNIFGTGIVLIDSIDLEAGKTLSLMPNTALYETGSAAVFLKQEDNSYLLINGNIPGILDEDYSLNGVDLRIPGGSEIVLNAFAIRKETWPSDDGEVTDISRYKDELPSEDCFPFHTGGNVELTGVAARLVLEQGSSLTVDNGASVRLEKVVSTIIGVDFDRPVSELVVKGDLNNNGVIDGGFISIDDDGFLWGDGKVLSSEVILNARGRISESILLESSGLTINSEGMTVSANIKDSIIYLKASYIILNDLYVSGTSWVGVEPRTKEGTFYSGCSIGNVTCSPGGSLEIVCNDHNYIPLNDRDADYVPDFDLTISGMINGGTVSVLAGRVEYTGNQTEIIPVVPEGYISRVYVTGFDIDSKDYPLNMSSTDAAGMASSELIPVRYIKVQETLISNDIRARKWAVDTWDDLEELKRDDDQEYTCETFLDAYGLEGQISELSYCTAVELIHSDLSRELYFFDDTGTFSTAGVILIRVLDCIGRGGQGGAPISHTDTTFTGSGTLGGTVDGSATTGSSTVVYPPNYNEPTTEETEETTENKTEETNETTGSEEITEETGTTAEEEGTTAKEEGTTGGETGTTETVSGNTDSGTGGNNNGYYWQDTNINGGLTPVVTKEGNGRYNLTVYDNWEIIDSLDGKSVTVTVQKPEGMTGNVVCYAVFENNGQKEWIPADYDSVTKKLVFKTDRTGEFGIARVLIEDVKLHSTDTAAPVYRTLSVMIGKEKITDLTVTLNAEAVFAAGENYGADVYAVFVDENETLKVFPVTYDGKEMKYRFETDVTGNFVLVQLDDAPVSVSELADACSRSDEVRILITIMRLYAFWS